MRMARFQVALCILALLGSSLSGATAFAARIAPFVVALPNGYEIARQRDGQLAVLKRSNKSVVTAPLGTYAVVRDVVTGLVPEPESQDAKANGKSRSTAGYFILKTATGELVQGLSEEDWKAQLKALGVTLIPTLNAPILPG